MSLRQLFLSATIAAAAITIPTAVSAQAITILNDFQTEGFIVAVDVGNVGYNSVSFGTTLIAFGKDSSGQMVEFWAGLSVYCPDSSSQYNRLSDFRKMSGSQIDRQMTYDEIQKYFPESRVWRMRNIVCDGGTYNVLNASSMDYVREYYRNYVEQRR